MVSSEIYLHPYIFLNKKVPHYFVIWIIVHVVFFFFLLLLSMMYQLEKRLEYVGYYQNEVIKMLVDESYFSLSNNEVLIQKEIYKYKVEKITTIAYEEGKASLWEVSISLNLPERLKIENNQIQLSFLKEKNTIFQQIINHIKKGMRF